MTPQEALKKYYRKTSKTYRYEKNIKSDRKGIFVQDASNCWMFSAFNNFYLRTGIKVDIQKHKDQLQSWGIDTNKGLKSLLASLSICDQHQDKHIIVGELSVLKDTKLFAEMLKAGYWFMYARYHNESMADDVRSDDKVDNIIKKEEGRHATNIGFINGALYEDGTRRESNILDTFSYADTNVFVKSVREGGIDDVVYFLDIDPNFR